MAVHTDGTGTHPAIRITWKPGSQQDRLHDRWKCQCPGTLKRSAFAENGHDLPYMQGKRTTLPELHGQDGPELAEFTNGRITRGWMYTLNGFHSDLGVKEQYLEDGDEIVFHYTDDYRKEHEHEWSESWSYDSESHWHECVSRYGTCDITDNTKKGGYQKHSYGDGKLITAATCKADGKKEYTCLVCGYTKDGNSKTSQHSYDLEPH